MLLNALIDIFLVVCGLLGILFALLLAYVNVMLVAGFISAFKNK